MKVDYIIHTFYYLYDTLFYDIYNLEMNFISQILQYTLGFTNCFATLAHAVICVHTRHTLRKRMQFIGYGWIFIYNYEIFHAKYSKVFITIEGTNDECQTVVFLSQSKTSNILFTVDFIYEKIILSIFYQNQHSWVQNMHLYI